MVPDVELRGVVYIMLREAFPHLGDVFDEEIGKLFRELKADGWYGAEPYVRARDFLSAHISAEARTVVGTRLIELFEEQLSEWHIDSIATLAERVNEVYGEYARGPDAGTWKLEEYRDGRAILSYDGLFAGPSLCVGIMKGALEHMGAYNVQVNVVEEKARGGAVDRYLLEWMGP